MLFKKILQKNYFKNIKSIFDVYSFKEFLENQSPSRYSHRAFFDPDAYIPIGFLTIVVSGACAFGSVFLSLFIISLFLSFVVGVQLYLLRDIIANFIQILVMNNIIKNFEKEYIYNSSNFLQLMHEIEFNKLSDSTQNHIINNISYKNFSIDDMKTIYQLIIDTNNSQLKNNIQNFTKEQTGENYTFFNKSSYK